MRTHRTRKATTCRRSALGLLVEAAADELEARGRTRMPAAPWLEAGRIEVIRSQGCGWEMDTTPVTRVERDLAARGWAWAWEGEDLVLEIPGWAPPPVRVVAVQPGLFD